MGGEGNEGEREGRKKEFAPRPPIFTTDRHQWSPSLHHSVAGRRVGLQTNRIRSK